MTRAQRLREADARRKKRTPAREKRKARIRWEHNKAIRQGRLASGFDDCADLMAPLAIAYMGARPADGKLEAEVARLKAGS